MTRFIYYAAAMALTAALTFGTGYLKGRSDGRVEILKDTVAAYEKREGIDHDVSKLDRVRLCVELGGLPDECEQLRGVETDPLGTGERGIPRG